MHSYTSVGCWRWRRFEFDEQHLCLVSAAIPFEAVATEVVAIVHRDAQSPKRDTTHALSPRQCSHAPRERQGEAAQATPDGVMHKSQSHCARMQVSGTLLSDCSHLENHDCKAIILSIHVNGNVHDSCKFTNYMRLTMQYIHTFSYTHLLKSETTYLLRLRVDGIHKYLENSQVAE